MSLVIFTLWICQLLRNSRIRMCLFLALSDSLWYSGGQDHLVCHLLLPTTPEPGLGPTAEWTPL